MLEPFFNLISMAIINLLGPRFETYDPRLKPFFLKNLKSQVDFAYSKKNPYSGT